MSAIDLATLRAAVRFRGDYQNVRKFPDEDLNREIQTSFAEFYELIADTYEGYWDTQGTKTTTASTSFVALPADGWRVFGVDRLDGDQYVELRQVGTGDRNRFSTTTGTPVAYRLTARGIDLFPTPDAAYTLRVTYTPIAPALQEAQAREWFNGWENLVINLTLLKLDQREQRPLNERLAIIDREKMRITSGATKRKSQEPEYLNLREHVSVDPWDRENY